MNGLLVVLAVLAVAVTQLLEGGYELFLCLPGYGLLALAALLSWWPSRRTTIPQEAADTLAAGTLFFAYIAGRALYSPEEYLARNDLYMALAAITLYLLIALNLTASKWRGLFLASLLLLATANCVIGAIQFSKGENFMVFDFLPRPDYGSRASGFYGYPNHLAAFLEVGLMMGLAVAFWSHWRPWVKILAGYGALVCLVGILLTGSRGGYIGSAAGLIILGLLSLRLAGKLALSRAIGVIAAGCLLFGALGWGVQHFLSKSSLLHSRVEQTVTVSDIRLQLWRVAWRQFKLNPIVGTGSGTYLYYGRQFHNPALRGDPVHTHNEYLELLAEYGILGIAAALMFLDTHLRSGWRAFSRHLASQADSLAIGSPSLALTVGAMSAAAACLAHSLMDFTLHMPANMLVMAFVFGLLASPGGTRESSSRSSQTDSNLPAYFRLVLPALGLWCAVRALPILPAEYFGRKAQAVIADWKYMESAEVARGLEEITRRGLAWDKRNPSLYLYAGMAQTARATQSTDPATQKEWSAKAIVSYEKAAQLAPSNTRFVLALAWALDMSQRFAESAPLYERALKVDPYSADVRYAYAAHLHAQGKLVEAAAEYRKSIKLDNGQTAKMGLERVTEELRSRAPGEVGALEPSANREPAR